MEFTDLLSLPGATIDEGTAVDKESSASIRTNVALPLDSSSLEGKVVTSPRKNNSIYKPILVKEQSSETEPRNRLAKKRVSFKQEGEESLLSSVPTTQEKKDEEKEAEKIRILEESRRLFWTSNERVKEERQRRKSLETRSSGKRGSFSLQCRQHLPKMLNTLLFDESGASDSDSEGEQITEMEIFTSFRTIQNNNIHNLRRHSHYE